MFVGIYEQGTKCSLVFTNKAQNVRCKIKQNVRLNNAKYSMILNKSYEKYSRYMHRVLSE